MPVKYNYDSKAKTVHAYPYAELSISEILGYFADLMQENDIAAQSIEVVHFDRVEKFLFSFEEAEEITTRLTQLRNENELLGTILVGKRDYHYGIARMMQTLIEINDPDYMTFVVRSDKELQNAIHDISV